MLSPYTLEPIGIVHSPYTEKFAVPRQPGLVPAASASIQLLGAAGQPDCTRGLEDFSHIWVLFLFHHTQAQGWHPLVRPPRLGGNQKLGVFATRSTFRPNSIGMSVVELTKVHYENNETWLEIRGADLVSGTPVIDIKPYLPYADAVTTAQAGFATDAPTSSLTTTFSATAEQQIAALEQRYPQLKQLICQVLAQDPRPAYKQKLESQREYGMNLYDLNIRWQVSSGQNCVISVNKAF